MVFMYFKKLNNMLESFTISRLLFFVGMFMSIFLISCDKDDEPKPVTQDNSANEPIAKKWEVDQTASNGKISAEASDFLWFEFTMEGYYIILKSDMQTYTGTYTKDGSTITLSDFGVLEISDVSDSNFSFSFIAAGETESTQIFTNVAEEVIAKSSKTELMCKTWSVKRQYGNLGQEYDQSYPSAMFPEYTVVFSAYGTYLISLTYGDGRKQIWNRHWQWKNAEETMICYGDVSSECTGENETTVKKLTETAFELQTVITSSNSEINDILEVYSK